MKKELAMFLASNLRNAWISDGIIYVYVRKSKRLFLEVEGVLLPAIDIANIQIKKHNQGKGYFKEFIQHVESLGVNVFVESVQNKQLKENLLKHGYKQTLTGESVYKFYSAEENTNVFHSS